MIFSNNKRGFTVIELLVATTVTLIVAGIMIAVVSNVLTAWTRSSGSLSTNGQARLVLDVLSEDLQSAVYRSNDQNVWLAASIETRSTLISAANRHGWEESLGNHRKPDVESLELEDGGDPVALRDARFGYGGTWLRFFTRRGVFASDGAPVAVSYKIVRRPTTTANNAEASYVLYRAEVRPFASGTPGQPDWRPGTFDAGYSLDPDPTVTPPNPYYTHKETGTAGNNNNVSTREDPFTVTGPDRSSVLAEGVIDFGVRFYTSPGGLVYPVSENTSALEYLAGGNFLAFPEAVEIFVRILTPEGIQLIQNYENAPAGYRQPDTWWEIAEAHSHVYTRRVQLNR